MKDMVFWLLSIYFSFETTVFKCYQRTGSTIISDCVRPLQVWSFSTITAVESGTESTGAKEQHRDQKRLENTRTGSCSSHEMDSKAEWLLGTTKGGNSWKHPESTEELIHMGTNVALRASSDTCTSCAWDLLLASVDQLPFDTSMSDLGSTKLEKFYFHDFPHVQKILPLEYYFLSWL